MLDKLFSPNNMSDGIITVSFTELVSSHKTWKPEVIHLLHLFVLFSMTHCIMFLFLFEDKNHTKLSKHQFSLKLNIVYLFANNFLLDNSQLYT